MQHTFKAVRGLACLRPQQFASGLQALLSSVNAKALPVNAHAVLDVSSEQSNCQALRTFGCVSLSPRVLQAKTSQGTSFERVLQHAASHKRRPEKGMPLAQGVAFLASKGQLTHEHLMSGMSQLAEVFIDNAHTYSVEELGAWCEICRQLDFVGSEHNHLAMTEAVCSALEGRICELSPSELAAAAWMLASSGTPLPPSMQKEMVRAIISHSDELTPDECITLSEAVGRVSMGHHPDLTATLVLTAARSLRDCDPATAVRLAATGLSSALHPASSERGMVVKSLVAHMASREKQYLNDHHTLEQSLNLVSTLAAGHPALQEYVAAVQHMAHCLPQDAFRPLETPPMCAHAM